LKLIEGAEGNKAAILATEEINAKGGVKVGKEKRLLKIESLDIRDGEPGSLPLKHYSESKSLFWIRRSMLSSWVILGLRFFLLRWISCPSINCPTFAPLL
jgi:hypothetical protein